MIHCKFIQGLEIKCIHGSGAVVLLSFLNSEIGHDVARHCGGFR